MTTPVVRANDFLVVQVIHGGEGYGVGTVLRTIRDGLPAASFVSLGEGKMADDIPRERLLWAGRGTAGLAAGPSTWGAIVRALGRLSGWWRASKEICRVLPSRPAILHCHDQYTALVARFVKFRRPRESTFVLLHFHGNMNPRRWRGLLSRLQRFLFGRCVLDALVSVSHASASCWLPLKCPVRILYNGIDPRDPSVPPLPLPAREGVKNLLIAGSLTRDKGHMVAVEAMRLLGDRGREFHLYIAGGPTEERENPFAGDLRRAIDAWRLGDRVTLLGFVPDVRRYLPGVFACLQQRISPEPFAMWVLEALNEGVPLIACANGGVPEAVRDGVEGLLVPPASPEEVAKAILRLADDPSLRDRLARAAIGRADEFRVGRFLEKVEEIYREIVGGEGVGAV